MKKRVSGVLLLSLLAILILSGSAAAAQMTKPALGAAQAKTFDIEATVLTLFKGETYLFSRS